MGLKKSFMLLFSVIVDETSGAVFTQVDTMINNGHEHQIFMNKIREKHPNGKCHFWIPAMLDWETYENHEKPVLHDLYKEYKV